MLQPISFGSKVRTVSLSLSSPDPRGCDYSPSAAKSRFKTLSTILHSFDSSLVSGEVVGEMNSKDWMKKKSWRVNQGVRKSIMPRKLVMSAVKRHKKNAAKVVFIPLEIVADILSRLPVSSLLRLCCVCKQWCSLIRSPEFIKEQHARALCRRPLVISQERYNEKISLFDFWGDDEIKDRSFCINLEERFNCWLTNSFNGLVCGYNHVGSDAYMYLLNPSTRELVELPRSNNTYVNVGLGFDVSTREYKLVKLFYNMGECRWSCGCEVLTVGAFQWRSVGSFPCRLPVSRPVFVNGALHWLCMISLVPSILVFNVKDEMFCWMPAPELAERSFCRHSIALSDSEGHLLFSQHPFELPPIFGVSEKNITIWVRDYASQKWNPFRKIDITRFLVESSRLRVIGVSGHQILFLRRWFADPASRGPHRLRHGAVYSYDLHTATVQDINCGISSFGGCLGFFTESLVSPKKLVGNLHLLQTDDGHKVVM